MLKSIFTADSSTSRVQGLTMPVSMDVNVANSAVCYGHIGCEDPIEKVYQYVGVRNRFASSCSGKQSHDNVVF